MALSYSDFGKKSKDLLVRDFPHDQDKKRERSRVDIKTTTVSGTGLSVSIFRKADADGTFEGNFNLKRALADGVNGEFDVTSSNIKVGTTITKAQNGVKFGLALEAAPESILAKEVEGAKEAPKIGGSFDIEYKNNNATVNLKGEQKKTGEREASLGIAVVRDQNLIGFGGRFDVRTSALLEAGVAFQRNEADAQLTFAVTNEAVEGGRKWTAKANAWHQYSSSSQVGIEATVPLGSASASTIRAVVARDLGSGEVVKGRLEVPTGRLGVSLSSKLGAHSTLGLSADVDVRGVAKGIDQNTARFGVNLSVNA